MAPTIRIDDEVYGWLQKQASPFEDTPNSVLRRIAGIDQSNGFNGDGGQVLGSRTRGGFRRPRMNSGRKLNKEWKVGAEHALFHQDGCWYNNLERFPGALFDPNGYVLFATEEEFKNCPFLSIGSQTNVNVSPGISAIPGYIRKREN